MASPKPPRGQEYLGGFLGSLVDAGVDSGNHFIIFGVVDVLRIVEASAD